MASGGGRFLQRFRPFDPPACRIALGGIAMDWTMVLALVIGVLLCVYLLVALLNPERFS